MAITAVPWPLFSGDQITVYKVLEGGQAFQTSWYFLSSLTSSWSSSCIASKVITHTSSLSSLSTWSSALLVLLLPDSLHAYILFGVDQNLGFLLPPNISLSWSWKVGSGSGRNIEESYQIKSSLPLAWMWINSACDMDPLQRGWEFWDKKQQVLWWDSGTKILILSFNTL